MTVRKNAVAMNKRPPFPAVFAAGGNSIHDRRERRPWEYPITSASACPPAGQRGGERIERFGGSSPVPLRVRDAAGKYAGDRKTERL